MSPESMTVSEFDRLVDPVVVVIEELFAALPEEAKAGAAYTLRLAIDDSLAGDDDDDED